MAEVRVRRNSDDIWCCRPYLGRSAATGRPIRPYRSFPEARSEAEAQAMAEAWVAPMAAGDLPSCLMAYVDDVEAMGARRGRGPRPNTVRNYRLMARRLGEILAGETTSTVTAAKVTCAYRELLDPEKSFSSYLYTIARNKVLNYLRHVARSETLSRKYIQAYSDSPEYEPECGEELLEKDYFALLRQAIFRLSPRQRQVFCMSRNGNMTHKEIAERLGLSVYTIQEYMSDSLKSIKDYVSKHSDIIFPLLLIFFNLH